ncbi:MAG: hypothetical protein H6810_05945 [Phycisphaeraceae bacterium]|nr:MAG: hypothetical protein H6810_05945 [Phycisphaeraceae bacterium]
MTGFRRLVRGAGLGLAGTISLVLGVLAAERLVRPGVIDLVNTPVLVGLVLLFVLPVLTFMAMRHDGRVVARLRDLAAPRGEPRLGLAAFATSAPDDASTHDVRVVRHGAHDRQVAAEHRPAGQSRPVAAD